MPSVKKTKSKAAQPAKKRGRPPKAKTPAKTTAKSRVTASKKAPVKAKVKATTVKKSKSQDKGQVLIQSFQDSLKALTQYWPKQRDALKKEAADLKAKQKKVADKLKTAKGRMLEKVQAEAKTLKQAYTQASANADVAKLAHDKYKQLNREISQFEKAWRLEQKARKAAEAEKASEKAEKLAAKKALLKEKASTKKAKAADKPKSKRGRKPKAAAPAVAEAPKAKRGRKPKAESAKAEKPAAKRRGRKPKAKANEESMVAEAGMGQSAFEINAPELVEELTMAIEE